jgi:hypothetical protein
MNQPKAKIFLADKRGCNETDRFRSYSTFNFGEYFNEYKHPFGNLYGLNDNTIAAGHAVSLRVEKNSCVLLLPVVGTILCKTKGYLSIVNTGQLQIFRAPRGAAIELQNCYKNELINFLEIWIKADIPGNNDIHRLLTFNLDENKNRIIRITESIISDPDNPVVSIGKFTGRHEAVYALKGKQNNLFIFVIEGVFEVEGRLLHARDGLAVWNEPDEIELEALSNDAILLIIEMNKAL